MLSVATLVIGLLATVIAYVAVQTREKQLIETQFTFDASQRLRAIERNVEANLAVLESISAFYGSSEVVERDEFAGFAKAMLKDRPTIHAVEFAPRVDAAGRELHEQTTQAEGFDGYVIRELAEDGSTIPAGERDVYFPVNFIEPMPANEAALGLDMLNEPTRGEALKSAVQNGTIVGTAPIQLVQKNTWAFLAFVPVYHKSPDPPTDDPDATPDIRTLADAQGVVLCVIPYETLVADTLGDRMGGGIALAITDQSPTGDDVKVYSAAPAGEDTASDALSHRSRIIVAGRRWLISFISTNRYVDRHRTLAPLGSLVIGSLVTLLFTGLMWTTAGRTSLIEAIVEQRTHELKETNDALEREITTRNELESELINKTNEFQQVFDSAPSMIWYKAKDGRFLMVNRAAANAAGRTVREMIGKTDHDIYPRYADQYIADDREVMATAESKLGIEEPHLVSGGGRRWVRTDKVPFVEDEEVIGIIIVASDITDRVEAEQALRKADERLNLALRSSGVGTWDRHIAEDRIVWDDYMPPLFGLEPGEFDGTQDGLLALIHPDDRQRAADEITVALREDIEYESEYRVVWPDKSVHVLTSRGRVYRDGVGQPVRMTGVCFDVTDTKLAEQALRESEHRFRQLAENISEVFWITDAEAKRILYISPAYETVWGRPTQTLYDDSRAWIDSIHADDRQRVADAFKNDAARGRYDQEYRVVRPDESVRWVRDRGFPVKDEAGQVVRIAGIAHDITDRKRAAEVLAKQAERLVQTNAELKRSNEELDAFAYIASHDLKEPLRGLSHYASFLVEDYGDQLEGDGKQYIASLTRLCNRMESLIDSLLYYSRVGRTELAVEPTDLSTTVDDVLERVRPSLDERGVEVRVPRPLPTVKCDAARIGEVFANLITNASKYNDKDEKWVEVGFKSPDERGDLGPDAPRLNDGAIVFYVRDNGVGIPADRRDKVFEMFRRLHGRDKFGGGTGAGLTIVQKIVRRHGGDIWIDSTEGNGTTFYFTLEPA